jgi:Fe-S-cluster containining protein
MNTHNYGKLIGMATTLVRVIYTLTILRNKHLYKKSRRKKGVNEALSNSLKRIDKFNSEEMKITRQKIICKSGCSNCCHIPVMVTDDESLLILDYCKFKNIEIDVLKAHNQALAKQKLEMPRQERRCIFLDDKTNNCKIYPVRPLVCRSHFSLTEPEFCEWVDNKDSGMVHYFVPKTEIEIMSIWNCNILGLLPAMILKNLRVNKN